MFSLGQDPGSAFFIFISIFVLRNETKVSLSKITCTETKDKTELSGGISNFSNEKHIIPQRAPGPNKNFQTPQGK